MGLSLREIIVARIHNQKGVSANMVVHGPQTNAKQWAEAQAKVQAGYDAMLKIANNLTDDEYKSSKRGKKEEEKPAEVKGKGKKGAKKDTEKKDAVKEEEKQDAGEDTGTPNAE